MCVCTVRPGAVHDINVYTNDTGVYVMFNSPKRGRPLQYSVTADCAQDGSREVNCSVQVIDDDVIS